jgi:predicted ATP-dependent endonuclease of OLD family
LLQRNEDIFAHEREQRDRLRMLLNFDASANEAFFARRVCLVEGDCEIAAVDAIGRKLVADHRLTFDGWQQIRRRVVLINCRGKWTIRAFQRVLQGFSIDYVVVHDADAEGDSGANAEILAALDGIEDRRLVHRPNFEKEIFQEEWSKDKPWKASEKIKAATTLTPEMMRFIQFVAGPELTEAYLPPTPHVSA